MSHYHMDELLVLVGIDPGTDTVGYSCGVLNQVTGALHIYTAITLEGAKDLRKLSDTDLPRRYNPMIARCLLLGNRVGRMVDADCADICILEDFYLGRNPSTYATLVRAQQSFLSAIYAHAPLTDIRLIKPSVGKTAFDVPTNASNKELMMAACVKLPFTTYEEGVIEGITEHSADAIAQLYAYVRAYREQHKLCL